MRCRPEQAFGIEVVEKLEAVLIERLAPTARPRGRTTA